MCSLSKQAQGGCDYFYEYTAYYQVVLQWEKWSTLKWNANDHTALAKNDVMHKSSRNFNVHLRCLTEHHAYM